MLLWQQETRELALRYTWKISRSAADLKVNLFISVTDGTSIGKGEAAPNLRYGETPELLQQQFDGLQAKGLAEIKSVEELHAVMGENKVLPSLRFALESTYVHYLCHKSGKTVPEYLGVPAVTSAPTAITFPIMDPGQIASFAQEQGFDRFDYLKVKVNEESGLDIMTQVAKNTRQGLIVDANEAWQDPDALMMFLEKLKKYPVLFVEQPMPAALQDEYLYLKKHTPYEIFADESVTDHADWDLLQMQFHGVNMKLMKAGGYLNGLAILNKTRELGLKTMIGCMVETTIGIWSALQLSAHVHYLDLDGMLVVKDEPFEWVKEEGGRLYPKPLP